MFKILLFSISLFILIGCGKPNPHPKNPKYEITVPKVKFKKASKENLSKLVQKLEGKPYVWAEEGPNKFDCSGYTYYMYGSMGINIPRVAREQAKKGKLVSYKNLKYGDLIFFDTTKNRSGKITHVGMYLGDGWFTHASTKEYKVTYSRLTKRYYKSRLKVCRRYLPNENNDIGKWKNKVNLLDEELYPTNITESDIKKKTIYSLNKEYKKIKTAKVIRSRKNKLLSLSGSYIQVGSYINKPKTSILIKISNLNLPYEIIRFPKDGKFINKLLIGPYNSREKAESILLKVRNNISKGAFLVKID